MREDFRHKISEVRFRDRYSPKTKNRSVRRTNKSFHIDEDSEFNENKYVDWDAGIRQFNYRLMDRFLRKYIGRKFNEAYHIICSGLDARTYEGKEIRRQLKYIPHAKGPLIFEHGRAEENGVHFWPGSYYVDHTGLLQFAPKQKRERYKKPKSPVLKINGRYYVKNNDQWYELEMRSIDITKNDVKTRRNIYGAYVISTDCYMKQPKVRFYSYNDYMKKNLEYAEYYYGLDNSGNYQYAARMMACNKKEIKKIKQYLEKKEGKDGTR